MNMNIVACVVLLFQSFSIQTIYIYIYIAHETNIRQGTLLSLSCMCHETDMYSKTVVELYDKPICTNTETLGVGIQLRPTVYARTESVGQIGISGTDCSCDLSCYGAVWGRQKD